MTKYLSVILVIITLTYCSRSLNNTVNNMAFRSIECTPANNYREMVEWRKGTGYDVLLGPLDSVNENGDSATVFLRSLKIQHSSILFSYFDCLNEDLRQSLENRDSYVMHIMNSSPKDNLHYTLRVKGDTIRKVSAFSASYQY